MDAFTLKALIEDLTPAHQRFIKQAEIARRYYRNNNDITIKKSPGNRNEEEQDEALRPSDNRIPNNYHQLLVDQKASYLMSDVPQFDTDDKVLNEEIVDVLGDIFNKTARDLVIHASNDAKTWLHVWKNADDAFSCAIVDAVQIMPIYSDTLDATLEAIIRHYVSKDDTDVYEYWDDTARYLFNRADGNLELIETMPHHWGRVPFIAFYNNNRRASDLDMYKSLIDVYDKVYSGFVNDIEDIQSVIIVLSGYSGTELGEFRENLKKFKAISIDGKDEGGAIDKLTIDIPTEARDKLLEMTRNRIFEAGQGLDPQDERIGTSSGVAMKFKYSLLELKSALLETEFRLGFAELIRFVLIHIGRNPVEFNRIKQTWKRTAINNDLELAEVVARLAPITSRENIAKANPIVEDWEIELALLQTEREKEGRMEDDFAKDGGVNE